MLKLGGQNGGKVRKNILLIFFIYFLNCALTFMLATWMIHLGIFPTPFAATRNRTHVSSVAPP